MSNTSNLVLPFLAVGQAQKHVTVNETLRRLDALVQLSVASTTTTAQPSSPDDGAVWIVPPGKSGADWSAFADWSLGYYRDGAWEQLTPREGWLAYVKDAGGLLRFDGAAWTAFAPGELLALSAADRVLGRASSGAGAAEEIAFTEAARQLCDDASHAAMCATLGAWRIVAGSGAAASHTGDTSETALATIAIPAGAMGPNGILRITCLWSWTNSASDKTLRVRLGGLSGAAVFQTTVNTSRILTVQRIIANRNSPSAQVAHAPTTLNPFTTSNAAPFTGAVDMSVAQDLVLSAELANAGDTATLESLLVEAAYRA